MSTKAENIKSLLANKGARSIILVTLGVLSFAIVIAYVMMSKKPASLPAEIQGVDTGTPPPMTDHDSSLQNSPRHQQMVTNVQNAMADQAEQEGRSIQPLREPTPVSVPEKPITTPEQPLAQAPSPPVNGYAGQPMQQPSPAQVAALNRANEAAQQILERSRPRAPAVFGFNDQPSAAAHSQMVVGSNSDQAKAVPTVPVAAQDARVARPLTLIAAGKIHAAKTDIASNTKVGGPAVVTLLDGPMAGAKLLGTVQRADETAKIDFNLLSAPSMGISLPITATTLDADTKTLGVASEVDRHLLTKYVLKPASAAVSAIGQAVARSNTTVTVGLAGVTESRGALSSEDKRGIILGSAAQQIHADVSALDTNPTVKVHEGVVIGVLFLSDVVYTPPNK